MWVVVVVAMLVVPELGVRCVNELPAEENFPVVNSVFVTLVLAD